jgi:hypothetical protein
MLDYFMQVSSLLTKFRLKSLFELPVLTIFVLLLADLVLMLAGVLAKVSRTDTGLAIHGRGFASPFQKVSLAVHSGAFRQRLRCLERAWIDKRATYAAHSLLWSRSRASCSPFDLEDEAPWTNNDVKP